MLILITSFEVRISKHAALTDIIIESDRISVVRTNVPSIFNPSGLSQIDVKRPDMMALPLHHVCL